MTQPHPSLKAAALQALRARIRALETGGGTAARFGFGDPAIDAALPEGGLPRGALHEVIGAAGAGAGFAAGLAGRLAAKVEGAVLWVAREPDLYAGGLAPFGIAAERLVLVRADRPSDLMWAMEEGLRTPGLAAVVGEPAAIDLTAGRRLQLAAEAGGVTGFVLRAEAAAGGAGAVTRWRVEAAPSRGEPASARRPGVGPTRWRVALERGRGMAEQNWLMEWDHATGHFAVVADLLDRPAAASPVVRRVA